MATGCLKVMKVAIFALGDSKDVLVNHEKYGTLFIYVGYCEMLISNLLYTYTPVLTQGNLYTGEGALPFANQLFWKIWEHKNVNSSLF